MRVSAKIINSIFLLLVLLLLPVAGSLHAQSEEKTPADVKKEAPTATPELANIIPMASDLSSRLRTLKNNISNFGDIASVQDEYTAVEVKLEELTGKFEELKELKDYKYNKIVALREKVKQKDKLYNEISGPLSDTIRHLSGWKKEWFAEKNRWAQFETLLLTDEKLDQLKPTFTKAHNTINTALDIVLSNLEITFAVQEKGSEIEGKINDLSSELSSLLTVERRAVLLDETLPILSIRFFAQFKNREVWQSVVKGIEDSLKPDSEDFASRGWIPFLQLFIFLILVITIHRNSKKLSDSERWRFFAERPFSVGFFLSFMMTVLIYEYQGVPATWKLVNTIFAGLSFTIFMGSLLEIPWKKHFVQGVITLLILTRVLEVLNFPLSIYRLYIVLAALIGLIFCLHLAKKSILGNDPAFYAWSLRILALFFGIIISAELWGYRSLSSHLFVSMIRTMTNIFIFSMFMYMVRGGLEWLFHSSPLKRVAVIHKDDTETIVRLMAHFLDLLITVLVLIPVILMTWGVFDTLEDATRHLLELGFNLGNQKISVGLVLIALSLLYCSFFISWIIQKLIIDEVFFKSRVEMGARLSMARLAHYAIMLVGFLMVMSSLGFEISKITIMLSALGVGIGFGLQGVVNNFVSGLILLFERPVRVGDMIELEGKWAKIKKIGLRATTVQTLDDADVIVPNADLVSNQVTNWTLSNRRARLIIPIGVAYGSDVPLVMETLTASAKDHHEIMNYPVPQVLFLDFGESTLDFELRVWVRDAEKRLPVGSDLRQEIDRRFREANIEIAFPQRDLHLRSVDGAVSKLPIAGTVN